MMAIDLRKLGTDLLANGKVEGNELETLRQELYADGKIDRQEAEFLVQLHKQVQRVTPAFEKFFFQALKDHLLAAGTLGAGETDWLRRMVFSGGTVSDLQLKFLRELKGEARQVSPQFQALFDEVMK